MEKKPSEEAKATAGLLRVWSSGRYPVKEDFQQLAEDWDRIAGKVERLEKAAGWPP